MTKAREPRFSMEQVDGRNLRVAHWKAEGKTDKLPLLFFNGIGANIEAMAPLAHMLHDRDFLPDLLRQAGCQPLDIADDLDHDRITRALRIKRGHLRGE